MLNNVLGLKVNPRVESQTSIIRDKSSGFGMLPHELFMKLLCLERKRTERSGRRFVLMLLDPGSLLKSAKMSVAANLLSAITQATRDTDLKGWYKDGSIIGVIFTEVGGGEDKSIVRALSTKLTDSLYDALSVPEINQIRLSFHIFPEDWEDDRPDGPVTSTLQMELAREINRKKVSLSAKRLMDIVRQPVGLILCLPVFVIIALAIKLTSRGPVLFRQVRLGQYGKKFTFLKFRSMYVDNDHQIHEEYVKRFIVGASGTEQTDREPPEAVQIDGGSQE